jgi:predicted nucleic acid-binding Zn ribbon protein
MPIREFKCKKCGRVTERIVFRDEAEVYCCGELSEMIRFSRPSPPKFEGAGFYENDYKEKSQ